TIIAGGGKISGASHPFIFLTNKLKSNITWSSINWVAWQERVHLPLPYKLFGPQITEASHHGKEIFTTILTHNFLTGRLIRPTIWKKQKHLLTGYGRSKKKIKNTLKDILA